MFEYDKKAEGLAIGSIKQYSMICKTLFIERYLQNMNITEVNQLNEIIVKGFVVDLRDNTDLKINTIQSYFRHVRIFLNWLYENGYAKIDFQRKTKNVRGYNVLKEIYTDEEIYYMFANIKGKSLNATRKRTVIALLLACGLRQHEVCTITLQDLFLEQGYLVVRQTKGRTDRRVPLPIPVRKAIFKYMQLRSVPVSAKNKDILFYTKRNQEMSTGALRDLVESVTKKIGIQRGNTHLFRHTFGTRMALETDNVFYVQQLMGHADLGTTKKYYHDAEQYRISNVKFDKIENILSRCLS